MKPLTFTDKKLQEDGCAKVLEEPHGKLNEILISFNDGSYKKVKHVEWKHSQWIHFTKANQKQVHVNPKNVNYMEDQ